MEKGFSSLLMVIKRRALPAVITFAAVVGGAVIYLQVAPRLYQASARLMLNDKQVSISELGRDLTETRRVTAPGGANPLADQAELVKSQRVLEKALTTAFPPGQNNSSSKELTVEELSRNLQVKNVPATNIIELNYQSPDPVLAAKLINAVSETIVEDNIKTISSEATKVRQFLETEVPIARRHLEQAEAKENSYRKQSGIVSFEEQTKSLVESVANLENQEQTLLAQLQEARSKEASLRNITDAKGLNTAYATVRGGQDEELKKLRAKLGELESQVIEAQLRFTNNHPSLIKLQQERNQTRALYQRELARVSPKNQTVSSDNVAGDQLSQDLTSQVIVNDVERAALEKKLKTLQTERINLQTRLAQLPIQQLPLTGLTRQREEAAESLKLLQSKLEEARIAEAQKVSNIRIIEEAKVPTSPASPRKLVVLVLAIATGTILATGVMLLLEVMDNTLRDASEAEDLLKLPLLGVLPTLPVNTLVLSPAERFLDDVGLVEPYRMLLKTLEFRSSDRLRLIVVSSTISGEGKSVVASHLAAVAAMLSRRTLLIDADLRRPIQHTLFDLPPKPGITDVIDGDMSLLKAVQPTDINNLFVLNCGQIYKCPSQLLESAAMKSLVEEAAKNFDYVILDTPPLSACADASTLSKYSDGLMLVTRPNFTIKEILQRAVSELSHNQIPVLGVVVNGMTPETEKYYCYPVTDYQPRLPKSLKRLSPVGGSSKNYLRDSRSK